MLANEISDNSLQLSAYEGNLQAVKQHFSDLGVLEAVLRAHGESKPHPAVRVAVTGKEAEVDCRDADGRTPLHWACAGGSVDTVEYLIGLGADVNNRDGVRGCMCMCVRLGPAFSRRVSQSKWTPLMSGTCALRSAASQVVFSHFCGWVDGAAASAGHIKIVHRLLAEVRMPIMHSPTRVD